MNKYVKRAFLGLGGTVVLVVVAAIVVAAFFQDAVGRKLIAEINKQLKTELKVGDFDLSLLRNFPDATVSLREVVVMGIDKDPLLEAEEVSFSFRLLSLFGQEVKIHTVAIQDGALNVRVAKNGKANYDIFKETEAEAPSSEFHISLEKATLQDMELLYRDDKLRQEMMANVKAAEFSGQFSSDKFDLKSNAQLVFHFLDLDGTRYMPGKQCGYDGVVQVDLVRGKYDLGKLRVTVEDNAFDVDGYVQSHKNFTDFDLKVAAQDASLETVVALLPEQYLSSLGDFTSSGQFRFEALVKGKLSAAERPAINFSFGLEDGKLSSPRLQEPFKDVSFSANFTNGEGRSAQQSVFEISDFKGYLNRELVTLRLRMTDLDAPNIDFELDGVLPVGYVYGLFNNPAITDGSGEVEIKHLRLQGLYRDMVSVDRVQSVAMSGDIDFDDTALKINDEKMVVDRGSLHFDNNLLSLENLRIEGAGSQIELRGNARNLLPVLFADSLNSTNVALEFAVELHSPRMDIGRLVKLTEVPVKESEVGAQVFDSLSVAKNEQRSRTTDFLKGTFVAQVEEFYFDKIEGKNFTGKLVFDQGQMRIEGNTAAMQGDFALDGTLFFEKEPWLEAKLDCKEIDVRTFFHQSNNFGQEYLVADNINGNMNAKMLIHAFWDSTGTFDMDKLHVWAGLGIQNGELKGFKMLEEFSEFVKIQDLRNIRFTDLQNWLEVKNSTFYLPVMFLQNNAMNLTVAGQQSFDDKIDYSIKVNAGQVLSNKFKKHNSKLDPIPAKESGFFNLYFNIAGTLDQYKYETNKRKVKEKFERSERQKSQIRAALIRAFGAPLNMLREPRDWGDEGEAASAASDDDTEYIPGF